MNSEGVHLGRALLAELRSDFGCEVWLDRGAPLVRFPKGYTPSQWELGFIGDHRAELVLALQEEQTSKKLPEERTEAAE